MGEIRRDLDWFTLMMKLSSEAGCCYRAAAAAAAVELLTSLLFVFTGLFFKTPPAASRIPMTCGGGV
jgi:hypothetical protein